MSERVLPAGFRGAAINEQGAVAGVYAPPGTVVTHAAIVSPEGELTDLGGFADLPTTVVQGINDNGQVVGYGVGDGGPPRGFVWSALSGFVALTDAGLVSSNPFAIDDDGNIVGAVEFPGGWDVAAYRPTGGRWEALPSLRGDQGSATGSDAFASSARGDVVGAATVVDPSDGVSVFVGLFWKSTLRRARPLPGIGGRQTVPVAISRNGKFIAGWALPAGSETPHPVAWLGSARKVVDLGTFGLPDDAGRGSVASGVNDAGEVVGSSWTPDGEQHAFVWTQDGGMVDVGTPGAFTHAFAINNRGDVLGIRESREGYQAVVWSLPRCRARGHTKP